MRGQRTAYLSLFDDEPIMQIAEKKGRNKQLLLQRNKLLIHRHYYYIKIKRRQFEETVYVLSNEFYLAERTILDILQKTTILKEMRDSKPDTHYFKNKYPHMVW